MPYAFLNMPEAVIITGAAVNSRCEQSLDLSNGIILCSKGPRKSHKSHGKSL